MRKIASAVLALALMIPAEAVATSEIHITLVAHVDVFCRISQTGSDVVNLQNGAADIGAVSEICNTPSGYDVRAQFVNLSGGQLNVAGTDYPIDATGIATRGSDHPDSQTLNWRLADAHLTAPGRKVVMRLTISPR